jgi:general secretion pathway protein H
VHDDGFSLLETLIALAIVALMVTVSVPMMTSGGNGLDLAVRQAETELRRAQSMAVRTNRIVEVAIDTSRGQVGGQHIAQAQPPVLLHVSTTADQKRSEAAGTIRFFPDGGSSGGGITLAQNGKSTQVLVDWLTGRVSVEK